MDWGLFHSLSKKVADKIVGSGYDADFMVGLARGGWVLSRVLCDFLGIKDLVSLKVEHWGITATPDGKAQIKYPFNIDLSGRKVLVVDDITDTGDSMMVAVDYIRTLNPEEVRTATLRHIKGSKFVPDFYGDEIDWRWVIFPWNYTEDMCNILPKVLQKCINHSEVRTRLRDDFKIEIDEEEIAQIMQEIERRSE
jgi:hypoxanthine phosphoribosyltransferase